MVNQVLNEITKSLHGRFGDDCRYYVEAIEQNVKTPCFTVGVLNPISRSVNSKDYYRTVPCVLHYYSNDRTNTLNDCYAIGEAVLDALEYLTVGGRTIRAENMSYMMVDDVLEIFLTYRFWTEKFGSTTPMEGVEIQNKSVV